MSYVWYSLFFCFNEDLRQCGAMRPAAYRSRSLLIARHCWHLLQYCPFWHLQSSRGGGRQACEGHLRA